MTFRGDGLLKAFAVLATVLTASCFPYALGTTARPVPAGEHIQTGTLTLVPRSGLPQDSSSITLPIADVMYRWGLDGVSDLGLRVFGASGAVITWHRLLGGGASPAESAVAMQTGLGLTFWGQPHWEGSLVVSGPEDRRATVYGGVRFMVQGPSDRGVHASPDAARRTAMAGGMVVGLRFGPQARSVGPEVGVFLVRNSVAPFRTSLVIVPGLALTGDVLRGWF